MMAQQRVPVWLDCDPGHDDVFAILLACYHPAIKLLGISTVFGNASLEKTTQNATSVLTAIGKDKEIPVYVGASKALYRPRMHPPTDIHGESGLDGTNLLPQPLTLPNTTVPAVDAMAAALKAEAPGTAWLVATGSFTNAAAFFMKYPELIEHVKGLSLMGGAIGGGFTPAVMGQVDGVPRVGNWTRFAEFNVIVDPEAAAFIFSNRPLAAKTTLVPLDVTHLVLATGDVQEMLLWGRDGERAGEAKTRLRQMLVELLFFFAKTYKDTFGIAEGPPLHDPLAVAAVLTGAGKDEIPFYDFDPKLEPNARQRERYEVTVITEGSYQDAQEGAQTGRTLVRLLEPGEEGVRIPRGLDIPAFWEVIEDCVEKADVVVLTSA